jgi:hypothetical protein
MLIGSATLCIAISALLLFTVSGFDRDPWPYMIVQAVLRFCEVVVVMCMLSLCYQTSGKRAKAMKLSTGEQQALVQ